MIITLIREYIIQSVNVYYKYGIRNRKIDNTKTRGGSSPREHLLII